MALLGSKLLAKVQVKGSTIHGMHKSDHITLLLQIFPWLCLAIKIKSKLSALAPKVPCDLTSASLSSFILCDLHLPSSTILLTYCSFFLSLKFNVVVLDFVSLPGITFLHRAQHTASFQSFSLQFCQGFPVILTTSIPVPLYLSFFTLK